MSEISVYTCDGCGATATDPRNWFRLAFTDGYFQFWTWDAAAMVDLELENIDGEEHQNSCSEWCAHKALSEWMIARRAETPVQRETKNAEASK